MKKVILAVCLLLGLAVVNQPIFAATGKTAAMAPAKCSQSAINFSKAMRALWEDHVIYTQFYIISALNDLPDADAIAERLLQNQDDIGNAIKPYYGNDAGAKLTSLLRDHILIAVEVVKAAKISNNEQLKAASDKWQKNADEIAAFLSSANPNWSNDSIKHMLKMHLEITTNNVVARLQKDWKKAINTFDEGEAFMLKFADTLSSGIIKQFPKKFAN